MKMMERKAYTAFGETGFGKTGRHHSNSVKGEWKWNRFVTEF